MHFGRKRKCPEPADGILWKRRRRPRPRRSRVNFVNPRAKPEDKEFEDVSDRNKHLDIYTKRALLKLSQSILSLQSYIGNSKLFQCTGTIIESQTDYSIILTSASLLRSSQLENSVAQDIKVIVYPDEGTPIEGQIEAFDFHFNLAIVRIDPSFPVALCSHPNDDISLDPEELGKVNPFNLYPHQTRSCDLTPGDLVIALGRLAAPPYNLMAAPGEYWVERCRFSDELNCKELLTATCKITDCGIGGPLINRHAQVIGICFSEITYTAFLPINVACLWWEHYKKYRQSRRPLLGMEVAILYTTSLYILEKVRLKFPDFVKGVIVEEVTPRSSADFAGIKRNDVIFQLDGKRVQSFLELFESMWHHVGESVEVSLVRPGEDMPLHLKMVVEEATPDNLYSWPKAYTSEDDEAYTSEDDDFEGL